MYKNKVHPPRRRLKSGKRILESRYRMQKVIGRKLGANEIVHHIDEDPTNNKLSNLMLISRAEHTRLHFKGKRKTRPKTYICVGCGKKSKMPTKGKIPKYCCGACYRSTLAGKGNPNYRHGQNVRPR